MPSKEAPSLPSFTKEQREILKLWVKAGGTCEFPGCNKYLLENEQLGHPVTIGDMAHIVGSKNTSKSPRGLSSLPISERNTESNLLLLYSEHHNEVIDKQQLVSFYPKEYLLNIKRIHEERIRTLTSLDESRQTAVISLMGSIR